MSGKLSWSAQRKFKTFYIHVDAVCRHGRSRITHAISREEMISTPANRFAWLVENTLARMNQEISAALPTVEAGK